MSETLLLEPSSWAEDIRRKNPLDQAGRSAAILSQMQSLGVDTKESICPECGQPLHLCVGDEVAPYLAHACSDAEHRCPGSFETVWHLAAKRAAGRLEGWACERRYDVGGRAFRADAMNDSTGECAEFVHTLSKDYAAKHVATKESGRIVLWMFDGAASFCKRIDDAPWALKKLLVRFDVQYAKSGQLVAKGCLRKRARQLVQKLGVESCYLHFHGMAFRCLECDENRDDLWELCGPESFFSKVVYGDKGLNDELIRARASGIDVASVGLGTNHTPDPKPVIDDVCRWGFLIDIRRSEKAAFESLDNGRQNSFKGGRWVAPEDWPGVLVNLPVACRCGSKFGVDVPIHDGKSVRRDCAQCNKFIVFTMWKGGQDGN